jgi:mycothiol synthase
MVGYIWTKVEPGLEGNPQGEVYAIAVHPEAQGMRLGTRLLAAGLEHLTSRGIGRVILYVEAGNKPAIAAYRRQGFTVIERHVQYQAAPPNPGAVGGSVHG